MNSAALHAYLRAVEERATSCPTVTDGTAAVSSGLVWLYGGHRAGLAASREVARCRASLAAGHAEPSGPLPVLVGLSQLLTAGPPRTAPSHPSPIAAPSDAAVRELVARASQGGLVPRSAAALELLELERRAGIGARHPDVRASIAVVEVERRIVHAQPPQVRDVLDSWLEASTLAAPAARPCLSLFVYDDVGQSSALAPSEGLDDLHSELRLWASRRPNLLSLIEWPAVAPGTATGRSTTWSVLDCPHGASVSCALPGVAFTEAELDAAASSLEWTPELEASVAIAIASVTEDPREVASVHASAVRELRGVGLLRYNPARRRGAKCGLWAWACDLAHKHGLRWTRRYTRLPERLHKSLPRAKPKKTHAHKLERLVDHGAALFSRAPLLRDCLVTLACRAAHGVRVPASAQTPLLEAIEDGWSRLRTAPLPALDALDELVVYPTVRDHVLRAVLALQALADGPDADEATQAARNALYRFGDLTTLLTRADLARATLVDNPQALRAIDAVAAEVRRAIDVRFEQPARLLCAFHGAPACGFAEDGVAMLSLELVRWLHELAVHGATQAVRARAARQLGETLGDGCVLERTQAALPAHYHAILAQLWRDPRPTDRAVAEALGLSEGNVRQRHLRAAERFEQVWP